MKLSLTICVVDICVILFRMCNFFSQCCCNSQYKSLLQISRRSFVNYVNVRVASDVKMRHKYDSQCIMSITYMNNKV